MHVHWCSKCYSLCLLQGYLLTSYMYYASGDYDVNWTTPQCILTLRLISKLPIYCTLHFSPLRSPHFGWFTYFSNVCILMVNWRGARSKAQSDTWCKVKFSFCFASKYKAIWKENLAVNQTSLTRAFFHSPLQFVSQFPCGWMEK